RRRVEPEPSVDHARGGNPADHATPDGLAMVPWPLLSPAGRQCFLARGQGIEVAERTIGWLGCRHNATQMLRFLHLDLRPLRTGHGPEMDNKAAQDRESSHRDPRFQDRAEHHLWLAWMQVHMNDRPVREECYVLGGWRSLRPVGV